MFTKTESGEARAAEDELHDLLGRARAGDVGALPSLRATLDGRPELWHAYGDLARHARDAWIGLIAGSDLALKESLARKVAALLHELTGHGATPLERLLADRIAASWLAVNYAAAAAQAAGASLRQASFALKRQESALRRHLLSIGALATLRKLVVTGATAAPAPVAALPDSEMVHVPAEGNVARPAEGPVDLPEAAGGESAEATRVIPFKPHRGSTRIRGA